MSGLSTHHVTVSHLSRVPSGTLPAGKQLAQLLLLVLLHRLHPPIVSLTLYVPCCVVCCVPADIQLACLAAPILCIPNELATTWLPPLDSLPQELRELVQVRGSVQTAWLLGPATTAPAYIEM